MSYIGSMNLKVVFIMSLLALSTLAIAARSDDDDIEAQVIASVEQSAGVRLLALSLTPP